MKIYKDRLTVIAERRAKMVAQLQQPQRYGAPVPSEQELRRFTDDQLLAKVAARFQMTLQEASAAVDEWVQSAAQWERQQARDKAREEARLARRPKRKMTLEQALERAKELEQERMELVAFINTIPVKELEQYERLTGCWANPRMNADSGYTLSKLIKIFKTVLVGRKDPDGRKAALAALSR